MAERPSSPSAAGAAARGGFMASIGPGALTRTATFSATPGAAVACALPGAGGSITSGAHRLLDKELVGEEHRAAAA